MGKYYVGRTIGEVRIYSATSAASLVSLKINVPKPIKYIPDLQLILPTCRVHMRKSSMLSTWTVERLLP